MARTRARDTGPKPRNDAYTALLALSFVATAVSCLLLYLDYSQYPTDKPPKVPAVLTAPTDGNPAAAGGAAPAPGGFGGAPAPAPAPAPAEAPKAAEPPKGAMAPAPTKTVEARPVSFKLPDLVVPPPPPPPIR